MDEWILAALLRHSKNQARREENCGELVKGTARKE
jgi:hypothetical protein